MSSKNALVEEENKSFEIGYTYCDQCAWNGIPSQKIVVIYLGVRPTNEPGYIYMYETYDYLENGSRIIHQHKFDPKLIDRLVNSIFDRSKAITL